MRSSNVQVIELIDTKKKRIEMLIKITYLNNIQKPLRKKIYLANKTKEKIPINILKTKKHIEFTNNCNFNGFFFVFSGKLVR